MTAKQSEIFLILTKTEMYVLNLEEESVHKTNQTVIITTSKSLKWLRWNGTAAHYSKKLKSC